MSLKILVLTTNTPHHAYFVWRLVEAGYETHVIEQTGTAVNSVEQKSFRAECEDYESHRWFAGGNYSLGNMCPVKPFSSVNEPEATRFLGAKTYDLAIAFGVGVIQANTMSELPSLCMNLHGGDPQRYRGLDSHLWSVYHRDLDALVTTLHLLNEKLDDGNIVSAGSLDLEQIETLYQLRALNTEMAVDITLGTLASIEAVGRAISYRQTTIGRYYSAMPGELLDLCRARFERLLTDRILK